MRLLKILREQWESLLPMLPRDFNLEETLRQSGALQRRREIRDAQTLLRLALVYSVCGKSLRWTAAWAKVQGLADLSDVALMKRLRNAEPWLRQLLGAKLTERFKAVKAESLAYRLRVVDATTASIPGSKGTDYRVHLGFDLGSLQIDRIEVTGAKGGESFTQLAIGSGDLILADRGYAHRRGLAAVRQAGADFLVRINWQNLPLEDSQGNRLDLPQWLEQIQGSDAVELEVLIAADQVRAIPAHAGRLIVSRRDAGAVEAERQRIHREASRKKREADPRTLKAAEYILLLTSVSRQDLPTEKALELYRLRWQIEMTFKRLKGLLHLGCLPVKDPALAQSCLCAKLLAALMLEDLTRDFLAFSPSSGSVQTGQHMENPADSLGRPLLCPPGATESFRSHRQSCRTEPLLLGFSTGSNQTSPSSHSHSSTAWRAQGLS